MLAWLILFAPGSALAAESTQETVKKNSQAASLSSARPSGSGFVMRWGTQLILNGRLFRFAGANVDWRGLKSNTYQPLNVYYPTSFEVEDALTTVREMGGTAVRYSKGRHYIFSSSVGSVIE